MADAAGTWITVAGHPVFIDKAKEAAYQKQKGFSLSPEDLKGVADKINGGGITYDPKNHADYGGKERYAVSVYPELSKTFDGKVSEHDIADYLDDNGEMLNKPGHALGGWHDSSSGKVYLDVSVTTGDKALAVELGKQYNQKAIFDLHSFSEIPTGGTGENTGNFGPTSEPTSSTVD